MDHGPIWLNIAYAVLVVVVTNVSISYLGAQAVWIASDIFLFWFALASWQYDFMPCPLNLEFRNSSRIRLININIIKLRKEGLVYSTQC